MSTQDLPRHFIFRKDKRFVFLVTRSIKSAMFSRKKRDLSTPSLPSPNELEPCMACCACQTRVAYARAMELRAYTSAYHHEASRLAIAAYQKELQERFHQYMSYDRVCRWARTAPRRSFGIAHHPRAHPFQYYLADSYPTTVAEWQPRWKIFPSACDALKAFPSLPHTCRLFLFENVSLQSTGITCTMFCPLPLWTQPVLKHLQAFPRNFPLDRDCLLSLLRIPRESMQHSGRVKRSSSGVCRISL